METLGVLIVISLCMILGAFCTLLYQDRHIWTKEYLNNLASKEKL